MIRKEANSVVLDVGGIGLQIFVPIPTLSNLPETGTKTTLLTHLIGRVQPDFEMTLYGFGSSEELQAFKILLGVTGVGAKVALALLSAVDVTELARALSTDDTKVLTRVPGVGPKLAQRLCLELGDKMAAFAFERKVERTAAGQQTAQENAAFEDAIEGLINLGYGRADVRRAVERASAAATDKTNASALIRQALTLLTGGR